MCSSFLLFLMEPMVAKRILPIFGGYLLVIKFERLGRAAR